MNIRLRHDTIVRSLRRSGTSTIDALADEVGASRRTILRDISALRDEGYVIHSDVGAEVACNLTLDRCRQRPNYRCQRFSRCLSVSRRCARRGTFHSQSWLIRGLAKIEKALPGDKVRDLRAFLDCLHIGQLSPLQDLTDMGRMDPELLPSFEAAFLGRHLIRFGYRDAKGRNTTREVEPQAMLILPPLWYLVGWDPMRDDFRHFRMDRINNPEVVPGSSFRRRHVPFEDDVCPYSDLHM